MISSVSGISAPQSNSPVQAAQTKPTAGMPSLPTQDTNSSTSTLSALQRSAPQSQESNTSSSPSTNLGGSVAQGRGTQLSFGDVIGKVTNLLSRFTAPLMQVAQTLGQGLSSLTSMVSSFSSLVMGGASSLASSVMGGISSLASPVMGMFKALLRL